MVVAAFNQEKALVRAFSVITPSCEALVSRFSILQCLLTLDSSVTGPGHWPPCAVMAVMWCRNAMCCYHLFMGRGDIRGHCYGDQATDHRPPSPSPANILLLLLRNQLKPDPIKEVPKYYRALIWVSFSYQSRTT